MSWRLFSIWVVVLIYATPAKSLQPTRKVDKLYVENKRNPTPSSYADAILSTSEEPHTKFYFPGHGGGKFAPWFLRKRFGENVFKMDLPELASTDNLHSPVGPLLKSLENVKLLFNSSKSWYLVNGCTSGNHIAMMTMMTLCRRKFKGLGKMPITPRFLVARDCHKSVFDGLRLTNSAATLLPSGVQDEYKISLGPNIEDIASALTDYDDHQPICGLILTRPTYQGVMCTSNHLKSIVNLCHHYNVPVLIDESHGSHLRFLSGEMHIDCHDGLSCGADFVVQSAHKTLNSLSQCALLHVGHQALGDKFILFDTVNKWHSALTTTSPNSLLLASLDGTQCHLSDEGVQLASMTASAITKVRKMIKKYKEINILEKKNLPQHLTTDPFRLCVQFPGVDCTAVDDYICKNWGIFCELNQPYSITYPVSIGADDEHLSLLRQGIQDACLKLHSKDEQTSNWRRMSNNERSIPGGSWKYRANVVQESMLDSQGIKQIPLLNAESFIGRIAAETISVYPPGTPIIVRGEVLTHESLLALSWIQDEIVNQHKKMSDFVIVGNMDQRLQSIMVFE